ncbi:hypothetical protein HYH03_019045 [Edaphochlamys debaryana]|uniref:Protein kinase domain-containing protein n=1 Tax=Edaphochlamys debaryana TaxID=47281 RepID=A0A835XGN1_9CHLO|nr:hypothetical protein HYH03_019045 [Edaphochlamys debaryana]|eukprot:KAG2482001.1 hypothetical protein HYH03_019045 [Edaphochlamys debaryana]
MLQGGHTYGPGVDVWAYGATLAEWATGLPLFPDVDPGLVQLIRLCLTLTPAARPSAAQLLRLPYFASAGLEPHSSPEPRLVAAHSSSP